MEPSDTNKLQKTKDVKREVGLVEADGPYRPFIIMEELLEKLKLLSYERDFCSHRFLTPISRHSCFQCFNRLTDGSLRNIFINFYWYMS